MSIQMTAMLDLEDILMTYGWEAKITLLKMWVVSMTFLIMLEVRRRLVFSIKYGILKIFRYDFN